MQNLKDRASAAGDRVQNEFDSAGNRLRYEGRQFENNVRYEAGRVENAVARGEQRIENAARDVKNQVQGAARQAKYDIEYAAAEVKDNVKQATRNWARANALEAPYFNDVGEIYDTTFSMPSVRDTRISLTTPNLFGGVWSRTRGQLTFVNDHGGNTRESKITANFRFNDVIGPKVARTPAVTGPHGDKVALQFEWKRPLKVAATARAIVPVQSTSNARPSMRATMDVNDLLSGVTVGTTAVADETAMSYQLRLRTLFGTISAVAKDNSKTGQRTVTASVASTLYRDSDRKSALSAGLLVDGGSFNPKQSSTPSSVAGVGARIEYDEPRFTVDLKVRGANYATNGSGNNMQLSEAAIRGIYCSSVGVYPRWCLGGTAGLVDGSDLTSGTHSGASFKAEDNDSAFAAFRDSVASHLTKPLVSGAFYAQLDRRNQIKLSADSNSKIAATYENSLSPNVKVVASLQASIPNIDFNNFSSNPAGAAKAALPINPTLGLGISFQAE